MSDNIQDWLSGFFELNPDVVKESDSKKSKEHKLDLFKTVLPALDKCDFDFYDKLAPEQRKEISFWTLTRWMSSTSSMSEHHLMMANDIANCNASVLSPKVTLGKVGHPSLQWKLLALCGTGKNQKHIWIAPPKGVVKNKLESAILKIYPSLKDDELELFLKINNEDDLLELFLNNGYDNESLKDLFK